MPIKRMRSELDCVAEVLKRHMDCIDRSKDFIEADKTKRLPDKVWILVELRYDAARVLTIDRIFESKETEPNTMPSGNSFKNMTENYSNHPYVKGLLKLINEDIQKTCK